ncbi:hypothetical protein GCM10023221_21990 [Luteimicrobium xylanilyticum]|uniref:Asp23/Gls24 family envelope stress response protein n=1 Tax=Luteimicrobium xylanilyticum TaxID=1133546 RepID=A0A5P9Q645_9MICO|nr:hypothetical protein [Luteimicrobium xylanilyticum]QFU96868.1 hypothetical protein KDY119_00358 [Luteimicrobium xylanilyticum]
MAERTAVAAEQPWGGATTVADRVVERVAERAAAIAARPAPEGPLQRAGATVSRLGDAARVAVRVTAVWPEPATSVAARVAGTVRTDLARMTGVDVREVDVVVEGYVAPARTRRVR